MDSLSPFVDGRFILPDVRSGGHLHRRSADPHPQRHASGCTRPGRTVCAVIDLYKQRINTPGVGIPAGLSVEDEERTMQLILSALNGYLPLTNRALMSLAGATVEVR